MNGQQEGEVNPFEALQLDRESEFMSQLCAPIIGIPDELFMFIEQSLGEQLHETVSYLTFTSFPPFISKSLLFIFISY